MADEAYWKERAAQLDHVRHGVSARLPMREDVLLGSGPLFAIHDTIALGVLGRVAEGRALLANILPRLERALENPDLFAELLPGERLLNLAMLKSNLHLGHWLLHGGFDSQLARQALEAAQLHLRSFAPRAALDGSSLLHWMLLTVEAGSKTEAAQLYERYEKAPAELPPRSLRFARNPRALLYVHLMAEGTESDLLRDARSKFAEAAAHWEKSLTPVSFVGITEAARILCACLNLVDRPSRPEEVFSLLR
jgi:hypothetical protein